MDPELHPKNDSNAIYSKKFEDMGFTTRAVHSGQQPEPIHGGVSTAIELSTTNAQTYPGVPFGKYDYSRAGNPTRTSLELQVASLEGGKYSQIYSSGMAATSACISLLKVGDEVLCIDDVYGGTQRYFKTISGSQQGIV
jgi:cystathionine gamma-lyase